MINDPVFSLTKLADLAGRMVRLFPRGKTSPWFGLAPVTELRALARVLGGGGSWKGVRYGSGGKSAMKDSSLGTSGNGVDVDPGVLGMGVPGAEVPPIPLASGRKFDEAAWRSCEETGVREREGREAGERGLCRPVLAGNDDERGEEDRDGPDNVMAGGMAGEVEVW